MSEPSGVETRLLHTLHELSVSTGRRLDPAELIQLVADRACRLIGGDAVALYLWDEGVALLIPVYHNDPLAPEDRSALRPGQGAAGQAMHRRQPVVITDYARWEHAVPWAVQRGLKVVEAVPLLVADRAIGVLAVRFYQSRQVSPEEEQVLAVLAAQVAPALEAARLYAASSLEGRHERALRELTQALAENHEERQVLELAVEHSARLLDAPYARVWLLEPNGELACAAAYGFVHAHTFNRRLAPDSTSGRAAHQELLHLANAPQAEGWYVNREFGERTGLGAYLGAGLRRAGESLGVLEVMRQTGRRYSQAEQQLLVSLANAVAVAVSNARTTAAVGRLAHEAEQRAAELAVSEHLLRSVYEAISAGVLVFDADGRVIAANTAAEEILGRPVAELVGMSADDLQVRTEPNAAPRVPAELPIAQLLSRHGVARKQLLNVTRPDGRQRWLQVDAVPFFAPDKTMRQVVTSFIDITERVQSDAALHRRDAILEAVAFAAERLLTVPNWHQSIDQVLQQLGAATGASRVYIVGPHQSEDADGSAQAVYEWHADDVPPRPRPPAGQPYLAATGLQRWEAILREGNTIQGVRRSFPPDEQAVLAAQGVCSVVAVPIFAGPTWWGLIGFDEAREDREWPPGAVEVLKTAAGTLGAAIVRQRAEASRLQLVREQAARAEAEAGQRRLAFLAEASQILASSLDYQTTLQSVARLAVQSLADYCIVDIRDPDGSIRRVAAAAAGAGTTNGGSRLKPPPPTIDPNGDHPIAQVLRSGQPLLYPNLPDELRPAPVADLRSGLLVPLVTRAGIRGVITCLRTSQRRAFDLGDQGLTQDLARRCALAIENAGLYREAREAISVRDEFLSVAAHELKTPLTSLRGYAQLMGRQLEKGEIPNPDRARRAASTIQYQADKLTRLVAQLLDVSRIQSGKLAIEREPTDLGRLVRAVVDTVRTQLKGHTLVAHLAKDAVVSIDPLRIEQVVTNLVDNAIKYSPDGGRIDVSLSVAPGGRWVRLMVRDRGVGVPLEHRAHIFDRFYQARSSGGPLSGMAGMGLGLYISKEIIELHGGRIEAEFPEDGGTRFIVTLPHR